MYTLIEHRKLTDNATSITFGSIPQNFTDLLMVFSIRLNGNDYFDINFNGSSSSIDQRILRGSGSSVVSYTTNTSIPGGVTPSYHTASTFSNGQIYIPNYANGTNKSFSVETVAENNSTAAFQAISAGLRSSTEAINSISIVAPSMYMVYFLPNSSVTLYGINRTNTAPGRPSRPKAIGGSITQVSGYWVHTFAGSGSFTPLEDLSAEYLVIAGGGGTTHGLGGGGGAGGYRSSVAGEMSGGGAGPEPRLFLTKNQTYAVTVGAGGAGNQGSNQNLGGQGSDSVLSTITSLGGGRGTAQSINYPSVPSGQSGGSGSGGVRNANGGGAGTAGQGYAGGSGSNSANGYGGGGGGGAGSVGGNGSNTAGGNGGSGVTSAITGSSVSRAGGGGGAVNEGTRGSATAGGGVGASDNGFTSATAGTANTGGGGGGGSTPYGMGQNGGSGIVIVRYKAD